MKKFSTVLFATLVSVSAIAHAGQIDRTSYKSSSTEACSDAQTQIESALKSPYNQCERAGGKFVTSTSTPDIKDVSGSWKGETKFKCTQIVTYECERK